MATAIAGGVVGASILALYFVPSLYVLSRRKASAAQAAPAPGHAAANDARGEPEPWHADRGACGARSPA